MSSRVEEQQAKAAEDAERLQKRIDRETRDAKSTNESRERFGALLKGNEKARESSKDNAERTDRDGRSSQQQGEKKATSEQNAERAARMARGGTLQHSRAMEQARSFAGTLQQQSTQSKDANQSRVDRRESGLKESRVEGDDRKTDLEKKATRKEDERDAARVEAREKHRPNAAIDGDTRRGGSSSGGGGAAMGQKTQAPAPTAKASGPREVKQLSPEVKAAIEKLADAIYIGVNAKGFKELHIELKEGFLSGGSLRISHGEDGISLTFGGLDAQQKNLIESSQGELMKRLSSKGVRLAKLKVA